MMLRGHKTRLSRRASAADRAGSVSPMYEPINVKRTPMVAMITYMNVGMVRTVWLRTR